VESPVVTTAFAGVATPPTPSRSLGEPPAPGPGRDVGDAESREDVEDAFDARDARGAVVALEVARVGADVAADVGAAVVEGTALDVGVPAAVRAAVVEGTALDVDVAAAVGAATRAASVGVGAGTTRSMLPTRPTTPSTSRPTSSGAARRPIRNTRGVGSSVGPASSPCTAGVRRGVSARSRWLVGGQGTPSRSAFRAAINSVTSSRPSGEQEVRDTVIDRRSGPQPTRRA
jgi:hypothetical protein